MANVLVVRIKSKGARGPGSFQYKNEIVLEDFRQLGVLLSDLEIHGANIEKAFEEYLQEKKKSLEWPFK